MRGAGATTIFFETLVSPRIAETVARETGAKTAVLDPIEGLTKQEVASGRGLLHASCARTSRARGRHSDAASRRAAATSRSPTPAARPCSSDVDLAVAAGEFVAIAGPNGGGKTTLLRLALGPRAAGSGRGSPLRRARRQRLAAAPRSAISPSARSSGSTRRRPCARSSPPAGSRRGGLLGPLRPRDRAVVADAIERVGLADSADRRCATLSGGQQQRAFIAKALAGEPALLVLDEPTAGVDVDAQEALARVARPAPPRARRHHPLRLARVRRGRALRRAARPRPRRDRLRRAARRASRPTGTTRPMSMLDADFMRLAFAAGAIVGVLAPAVGFFLVQRQMSLIGDGIGHVAFAGVAAGYLLGVSPVRPRSSRRSPARSRSSGCEPRSARPATRRSRSSSTRGSPPGSCSISAAGALNVNLFALPLRLDPDGDPADLAARRRARRRRARDDRAALPRRWSPSHSTRRARASRGVPGRLPERRRSRCSPA